MDTSRRRWSWTAFAVGLATGIPIGVVGLFLSAQDLGRSQLLEQIVVFWLSGDGSHPCFMGCSRISAPIARVRIQHGWGDRTVPGRTYSCTEEVDHR